MFVLFPRNYFIPALPKTPLAGKAERMRDGGG